MNGTMLQAFTWYLPADGGHWGRVAKHVEDLKRKGVTAVWLAPAYKGAAGRQDVGYGVYDLYDLGEFDQKGTVATKYGTCEEYLALCAALRKAGMDVIVDVVLNQRMGADATERVRARAVSNDDRNRFVSDWQEIEAWTKFTFPGRAGRYSDFVWDWHCFHGVDYNRLNHDTSIFLFEGKHWDVQVTLENGNFDYLMGCDVDLLYKPVYDELVRWAVWYVERTGATGLRLDAIKHMDRRFFVHWLPEVARRVGRELFVVGEYWEGDLASLTGYLGSERMMCLFDTTLHYKLHEASLANGRFDLSRVFEGTLVQADPTRAVTFVDNHDTQLGQSLESSVAEWFKPAAYALILLREAGYPCVFYGDLYGTPRVRMVPEVSAILQVRARLAYGRQRDWLDAPDLIGWTREGTGQIAGSGCAVVVSIASYGRKRMCVGECHANETWYCLVGDQPPVTLDGGGWADFDVAGGGLSVYVSERGLALLGDAYYV